MRCVLTGFLVALLAAVALTLIESLVICLGANPLLFERTDGVAPLLGIFVGAHVAARGGSWRSGLTVALIFVALWLLFWMYAMGRWRPVLWIEEGLPRLTATHVAWWSAALAAGLAGGLFRKVSAVFFAVMFTIISLVTLICLSQPPPANENPVEGVRRSPSSDVQFGPLPDGTMGWLHTFDFHGRSGLSVGIYDCDSDDETPYDDTNTSYMGQDLPALARKLNLRKMAAGRRILCVVNGGFFGASGWSVAHHEEPMVEDGHTRYPVDFLRPKDQSWFFATNPQEAVEGGHARFSMMPSPPPDDASNQEVPGKMVLGGVRPLRFAGKSVELKPGAGVTTLKCSRTSVGWNEDGSEFYVLTVFDPDGELASQLQRRSSSPQTGGWDVAQVQKFWEDRHVPFALLFDGGESTQLLFRKADGTYFHLLSGYQYSFTLGYLWQRPLRFALPILPPSEAHRGVLNYLYVEGAGDQTP